MSGKLSVRWPTMCAAALVCGLFLPATCGTLVAADLPVTVLANASQLQDDATLRDIRMVGQTAYAVGDHGAVWKSTDAGQTWKFLSVAPDVSDVSWESVSFPTSTIGWIAGGRVRPYERSHEGVLYTTRDGGLTWTKLDQTPLPFIKTVRFFDLEQGIAVGESTTRFPGGVLQTSDGGHTWTAMAATSTKVWRRAAFVSPEEGVVVGNLGERALIARGQLVPPSLPASGLENIQAVSADHTGRCWLAGDGGLLLVSSNSGVSWSPPETSLPRELEDFARFYAVAQHEADVWIGGAPGTVIWHSPDAGKTWERQPTGSPVPIHSIQFSSATQGCAVGSLGRILWTQDGGQTWQSARGDNRRLALLSLHAHPQRLSIPLLVRNAAEDGYRTGVGLFSREDIGPDAYLANGQEDELRATLLAAGGNDFSAGWRLPLAVPGIERDRKKLLEDWSLLTDRRFAEVVLSELVGQLRTWRPSVVVIDEPLPDDAPSLFLKQAMEAAVEQAASPTAFPAQQQLSGLQPWQVEKLFIRRALGSTGDCRFDPSDILPRQRTTLGQQSTFVAAHSRIEFDRPDARHEFQLLNSHIQTEAARKGFWTELNLASGSDARRTLAPITDLDYDDLLQQAEHRKTVQALTKQIVQQTDNGGLLLAQLDNLLGPLPPAEAAAQLKALAEEYRAKGEWALAEETYANLLDHYPQEPVTVEAMKWLVEYWTSTELNWQRLRATKSGIIKRDSRNREQVAGDIQQAIDIAISDGTDTARAARMQEFVNGLSPTEKGSVIPTSGDLNSVIAAAGSGGTEVGGVSASQQQMQLARWLEAATQLTDRLAVEHPRMFEEPELQFVAASLMRRRQRHRQADEINDKFLQSLKDDPWAVAARGEAFLLRPGAISPKPMVTSVATLKPPVLDGLLSDDCWGNASEMRLSENPVDPGADFVGSSQTGQRAEFNGPQTLVLICHDAEYLYLAASVSRESALPIDLPQLAGRPRDADLGLFDHLIFAFDVDRDYATTYQFEVDQRGWTRESCWHDARYNPQWFVAMDADAQTWRLEAAIPLVELVPPGTHAGAVWGLGVTRVMPGLGVHTWTGAGGEVPQPPRFGLLQLGR